MKQKPLYQQIAERIEGLIIRGSIKAGERLSVHRLTREFGVSRNTLENALGIMKYKGIVDTIPKSGTFVTANAWRLLCGQSPPDWEMIGSFGHHKASESFITEIRNRHLNTENLIYRHRFAFSEQDFHPYEFLGKALEEINMVSFIKQMASLETTTREAKSAVVEHMKNYGIHTQPDNVMIFNNNFQALSAMCFALLKRGTNLLRMNPDLMGSTEILSTLGVNHIIVKHDAEGMLPEDLERKVNNTRHNVLAINPVNHLPTGITMTAARMGKILKIVQKYKIPVIENGMRRDIWDTPPPPPLKSQDIHDQIIYMGTFDMARYTWTVVPEGILSRLQDVSFQIYGEADLVTLGLLTFMLKSGYYMEVMQKIRDINRKRIPVIQKMLEKYLSGIARWDPERIHYHLTLKFDSEIKTDKLFHECHNLSFFPGSYFREPSIIVLNSACESLESLENCLAILSAKVKNQLKK